MAGLRNKLRALAEINGEWAGIPMPISDAPLVVEPTYPNADALMALNAKREKPSDPRDEKAVIRNVFWSWWYRQNVIVYQDEGEKATFAPAGLTNQAEILLSTLGAADAWGIEQEALAIDTLGKMLPHRLFKQYLLTGMFMERSKRSGVHYVFRRLRPTVALSTRTGIAKILCTLCLHPIGYYAGSWAGAMCPTDDVIAHLALMRGDEHMFWRRANQHSPQRRESGL